MTEVLAFATIILPIVTALTQMVKTAVSIPKNLVPFISLTIGILIGFLAAPLTDLELTLRLWGGGLAGLSSTGLYELAFNNRVGKTK